ncbi:sugar-binding domain-containing protein [Bythopirellula goksoeyrii]|uniref:Beta-galactosidase n=1 Tax=Bythopirellula goksoeyrii TaxID=1400387 RepID=A0A5B9QD69_9BACT|nr:sugar-binding domain-containing protein [Bythopirellula goksoeyrii]QEG35749.1 Beta-galactosidase [Bythopirellula goksoeyrii]
MQLSAIQLIAVSQLLLRLSVLFCIWSYLAAISLAGEKISLDANWKFRLSEETQAYETMFDDSKWQVIQLPHDWSIEQSTDPQALAAGGGGFFPTGIGWYRRELVAPDEWRDQRISIEFEGVYRNAEVWINGVPLGKHPYGYTPFRYDLSKYLKYGEANSIAVRVDNSEQPNSRWYSGSGIYRHVWLHVNSSVYLDERDISIQTELISETEALIALEVTVSNNSPGRKSLNLVTDILDSDNETIASDTISCLVAPHSQANVARSITIPHPQLWSPDTPDLYTARLRIAEGDQVLDNTSIQFGVRTIDISATHGLLLNGKSVLLCGANVHHDNGPLGAAAFDRAETRKVEILKAAGFNAVRTAHNPPSIAFLDACDQVGMLVIDEAFDGWAAKKTPNDYGIVFHECWQRDLEAMLRRDRNHPSVIMWSIGNEVYERGNSEGLAIAKAMTKRIKELDSSRPITAGINGLGDKNEWSELDPLFDKLDVAGYNYELQRHRLDHLRSPSRVIMSAESYPQDVFANWKAVDEFPYVIGDFVWSGLDYLGESGIGRVFPSGERVMPHWEGSHYPWHGAICGDIDITGWRKPLSYYRNIVWDRGEMLYMAVKVPSPGKNEWQLSAWAQPNSLPSWTWPSHEGDELTVEVYSRYPIVRLYLNDQLVGEQLTSKEYEFRTEFKTTYTQGVLRAVGVENGIEQEEMVLTTAGKPSSIRLLPDRSTISADGQDLSFVTVEVVDDEGRVCPQSEAIVEYNINGPGRLAAIGSGDLATLESYLANPRHVFQGRSLVIIRSSDAPGTIELEACSTGLKSANTTIRAKNLVN